MTEDQRRIAEWLAKSRPETETQESLAADIERVTGWHITRDRYSKYESGSLPVGKKVFGYFVAYWATRGVHWPSEPTDTESPATSDGAGLSDLAEAIRDQAKAITDLAAQVKALTEALPDAAATAHLIAGAVDGALRVTLPAVLRAAGLPPK